MQDPVTEVLPYPASMDYAVAFGYRDGCYVTNVVYSNGKTCSNILQSIQVGVTRACPLKHTRSIIFMLYIFFFIKTRSLHVLACK